MARLCPSRRRGEGVDKGDHGRGVGEAVGGDGVRAIHKQDHDFVAKLRELTERDTAILDRLAE